MKVIAITIAAYDQCSATVSQLSVHWLLANIQADAFVRIEYDDMAAQSLFQHLHSNSESLSPEAKTQLVANAIAILVWVLPESDRSSIPLRPLIVKPKLSHVAR